MKNEQDRELKWDENVDATKKEFIALTPGKYRFRVKSFERARHGGSKSLPPCNKAVLKCEIMDEGGAVLAVIDHQLFLHTKTQGFLAQFFKALGVKAQDGRINMDWNKSIGKTGFCKVINKIETKKDNPSEKVIFNNIEKFLIPDNEDKEENAEESGDVPF
jgi:hypothetical protein